MLNINQNLIDSICREEQIVYLGLFGSFARGDIHSKSDVDLLVDFDQTKSFFELSRIQDKFEQVFHKKIDLVLRSVIKPELKSYISADLITLYGQK